MPWPTRETYSREHEPSGSLLAVGSRIPSGTGRMSSRERSTQCQPRNLDKVNPVLELALRITRVIRKEIAKVMATHVDRRQQSTRKIADRFSASDRDPLRYLWRGANADQAEEFDASAGNCTDGHCPVRLRFVTRAAVPARSASQSRVDTGSTSRAPGPSPGGPSSRIHPAHHLQGWQVHPAGRLDRACRSQRRVHDLDRGLYPTRRSRRGHPSQWSSMHFGQCTGLLLSLRRASSVGCCLQAR